MFDNVYKTASGEHRKYGIYAPGLDRFILIDSNDIWVTLQTAELLSSKLPTVAYILNSSAPDLTTSNCINYAILNKSNQRLNDVPITVSRQHPKLISLGADDKIVDLGLPADFTTIEKQSVLLELQEYAKYVHKLSYIVNLQEALGNHYDNKSFSKKYIPEDWCKNFYIAGDRTNQNIGVFEKIRHAIYFSLTKEELDNTIKEIWLEHITEQGPMMARFYNLLGQPIPLELENKTRFAPVISSFEII